MIDNGHTEAAQYYNEHCSSDLLSKVYWSGPDVVVGATAAKQDSSTHKGFIQLRDIIKGIWLLTPDLVKGFIGNVCEQ